IAPPLCRENPSISTSREGPEAPASIVRPPRVIQVPSGWSQTARSDEGERPLRRPPSPPAAASADQEHVRLHGDTHVEIDQLGERVPVGDAVALPDRLQLRVVEVEEAVAVPQRLELLLPDRELQWAELGARDVPLGHHPDERVDLVDVAVG